MFAILLEKFLPTLMASLGRGIAHALTALGVGAFLTGDQITSISGLVVAIVSVLVDAYLGHRAKKAQAAAVAVALATPVPADQFQPSA